MSSNTPAPQDNRGQSSQGRDEVQLKDQYRQIGSAAILGALACKLKQQDKKPDATRKLRAA